MLGRTNGYDRRIYSLKNAVSSCGRWPEPKNVWAYRLMLGLNKMRHLLSRLNDESGMASWRLKYLPCFPYSVPAKR